MATKQEYWVAADGSLFDTEADADEHDGMQVVYDDLAANLDKFWEGQPTGLVVKWLLKNYDVAKKLKSAPDGTKTTPPTPLPTPVTP